MIAAPRFEGTKGRAAYVAAAAAVFLGQYVVVLEPLASVAQHLDAHSWLVLSSPLRVAALAASHAGRSPGAAIAATVATFLADVALVWLSFLRARWIRRGGWIASLAVVPVVQLGVIAWLTFAPDADVEAEPPSALQARIDARTAVTSLLVGVGLIVAVVAVSTLAFGLYGVTLFLVSPFVIATAVGYLANRHHPVGFPRTIGVVTAAFLLGGAALMGLALEGLVCLILALPLIAVMGLIGAYVGLGLAKLGRRGRDVTLNSVAVIPLLLLAEAALPPRAAFDQIQSVEVAAPPAAVWDAVVHMGPIPDAPAAPFRWGLAYPLRGEILGTGVGSIRRGVFSTGVAYERVTKWEPGRALSFVVLSDPPSMRELSPYPQVNAPHANGYFRTTDACFTLASLGDGHTRLTLATHHELDLEPAFYWMPLADWAVHANKVRVLDHFRRQAEQNIRRSPD